jgi:hypothetical protein
MAISNHHKAWTSKAAIFTVALEDKVDVNK